MILPLEGRACWKHPRVVFECKKRKLSLKFFYFHDLIHSALSSCSVDQFLKIGTLLHELAVHERPLDSLIEMLRKDQVSQCITRSVSAQPGQSMYNQVSQCTTRSVSAQPGQSVYNQVSQSVHYSFSQCITRSVSALLGQSVHHQVSQCITGSVSAQLGQLVHY